MLAAQALAFDGPLVLAPAMNPRMWEHPATQANANLLARRGAFFVGPECGGMPPDNPEVYLNRPFVYLLIDCREQLPLFIGTVRSIE